MKRFNYLNFILTIIAILLALNLFTMLKKPQVVNAQAKVSPVLVEVGSTGMKGLSEVKTLGQDAIVLRAGDRVFVYKIETRTITGKKQSFYR